MIGSCVRRLSECESTNDEASQWAGQKQDPAPHGAVVVADTQTKGRGRQGRVWHSPPGQNLYFSVVLRLNLPAQRVPPVTLCAGLAVCEVVNTYGIGASIKWPNDVLVGTRKVAGILTEMSTLGTSPNTSTVIVGAGVNVNSVEFPPQLAASSLKLESGNEIDRAILLGEILSSMDTWVERYCAHGVSALQESFESCNLLLGRRIRAKVGGSLREGKVLSLSEDGGLLMQDSSGREHKIIAGEVVCIEKGTL